jgi:outer membrane protein
MSTSGKERRGGFIGSPRLAVFPFAVLLLAAIVPVSQAQERSLSITEAVQTALENNPSVESANWDRLAASAKAEAAALRLYPSLSLSASYQRLSNLPPGSFEIPNPSGPGTTSMELPASLRNVFDFGLDLQYPIFAGFRLRETIEIARLSADSKLTALRMVQRSLIFEVRRAYWEALRAGYNVRILQKNLELARSNYKLLVDQVDTGAATRAELLAADTRQKQAEMDLGNAVVLQKKADLQLASRIGWDVSELNVSSEPYDAALPFVLSTSPDQEIFPGIRGELDARSLIRAALAGRPEVRSSVLAQQAAEHSARLAASALFPTVSITGNLALADPNPRVAFQTDPWQFTGTWSLGVQMSYDIGGIPANLQDKKAQQLAVSKYMADASNLRNTIVLDVRSCILNLNRARNDLQLIGEMVAQAEEDARVARQRYEAGTLNEVGRLTGELNLLRARFAVINKQIDVQIASADLLRATAMEELP